MNLYSYMVERYTFKDTDKASFIYKEFLNKQAFNTLENEYGFITYKFEGDACIINDIYVNKEYRKSGKAWNLFEELLKIVQQTSCNVLIGFCEYEGKNHIDGQGAMLAAGFRPIQYLNDKIVFFRDTLDLKGN